MNRSRYLLIPLMVLLIACGLLQPGSAPDQTDEAAKSEAVPTTEVEGGESITATATEPGESENATPAPTGETGAENEPAALFLPVDGLVEIELLTPETGNGALPVFRWTLVEGARWYRVIVFREDGSAYWAWEGEGTEVILGNLPEPVNDNATGPRLLEPMTWAVVALDEDDRFIASSAVGVVAP